MKFYSFFPVLLLTLTNAVACPDCALQGTDQKVENPRPTLMSKNHMTNMVVVVKITAKKGGRGDDGPDHAGGVEHFAMGPDHDPSRDDQKGADGVKGGVERRKLVDCHLLPGLRLPRRRKGDVPDRSRGRS